MRMLWKFSLASLLVGSLFAYCQGVGATQTEANDPEARAVVHFVEQFCLDCHSTASSIAGLDLETLIERPVGESNEAWEKVARKLFVRQMPPPTRRRPDEATYRKTQNALESILDRIARDRPAPGRTSTFRRLTRTEYQNAVRDLLALDIDAAALLPIDESSHGFDNVTVADLSPTLMDRYVTAAQKISRLALGRTGSPTGDTIRVPADLTQEQHLDGLPLGTRGGTRFPYTFVRSGEYEFEVRLARDRNEEVEGLRGTHELELMVDRRVAARFEVKPPPNPADHTQVDRHLKTRVAVTAGPHQIAVTFVQNGSPLLETLRQPYQAHFNMHRHPRTGPAVFQVSITGPSSTDSTDATPVDTPARRRVLDREPSNANEEIDCARRNFARLIRRAYRRPATDADLERPMQLFMQTRQGDGFDAGIEMGLSTILASPQFLFRIERQPATVPPGHVYRISDFELASRLSFFLWSSIPDDELLDAAERGELHSPGVLARQVRRMLADERSTALATNFAGQWLHLRNLDSFTPDLRLFADFDHNLRQAFRRETELLFETVMRDDRSVLALLRSDHAYINERLAKHYGMRHVYGSRFRPVAVGSDEIRGGLLRHGSVLAVTSYATRTSPVIRGKWILENLIGTPPPPPPPNVPALEDNTVAANLPVRDRLEAHRTNAACAVCHDRIDPVGFALENFDAVGRWREREADRPVDASGGLPDGSQFDGVAGLESALLDHPDWFTQTMVEKLLTYALGRGVEYYDGPAVRQIVRTAREADFRFSSLIEGVVQSRPFQMRRAE